MKQKRLHILFLLLSILICGQSFIGFEIGNPTHQVVQKHQKKASNFYSQDELSVTDDWETEEEKDTNDSQKDAINIFCNAQHFTHFFSKLFFKIEKKSPLQFFEQKSANYSSIFILFRNLRI